MQAAAHGVAQGTLSLMQGASFKQAFIAGALGSLGASAWGYALNKVGLSQFASSAVGTVAFGALSGGIGAELSGGNFWQGAVIGGIVAGLNHAMHEIDFDPPKEVFVRHYDAKYSVEEGKWILSVKSEGYQMVDIAGASDGYQVINIYNSKGSVVGSLQGNDAYHILILLQKESLLTPIIQ
ncbi:hypothetical protein ACF3N7_07280 [Cruoricaptor ignavus]|uniref:hypothetical protein n=1 Tax=Cruoricaptor ignavus TaxID=1118202 RepID=UPI00370D87E9